MDWETYGPARCTDAAMLTIHIHSRWGRHHQTNGTDYLRADRNRQCAAETQGITNRPLVDEVINKPSIVTNNTRPGISYENVNDLARCEKALLEYPEPLRIGLSRETEMKRMQNRHSPATPLINITQLRRSVLLPSYTRSL